MAEHNPYETPQAAVAEPPGPDSGLASRGQRFGGALIDGLIGMAAAFPLMSALGIWRYASTGGSPPLAVQLLSGVLGFVIFMIIHGYLLAKNGQTVGKRLIGTRIVDLENRRLPLSRLIGRRYLPVMVVTMIPGIGPFLSIIDALFIFRSDRRCVHDLIAGTKVVRV